jgi:hypothetical protein
MMTAAEAAELAEKNRQSIVADIVCGIEDEIVKACNEGKRYYRYYGSLPKEVFEILVTQGYSIKPNSDLTYGVSINTISW